jgi:hypothetical protein
MATSHICEEKTTGPQTMQIILGHPTKIAAVAAKQAPCLQNNPEAYLNLWNSTVGICIKLSLGNPGDIPITCASDTNGCPVVCAKCGNKTRHTSSNSSTGSAKLQCHLPTAAYRSSQQPGRLLISRTKLQS